jgi:hypothetical protein
MIIAIAITVVFSVCAYAVYVAVTSWLDVRNAPREPMHLCPKHGPVRQKDMLNLLDNPILGALQATGNKAEVCPLCWNERMQLVRKRQVNTLKDA